MDLQKTFDILNDDLLLIPKLEKLEMYGFEIYALRYEKLLEEQNPKG